MPCRRQLFFAVLVATMLGPGARPCAASEAAMHKFTADELKRACDKAGGKFSQDPGGYGCGTNCQGKPGTDCIVACKNNDKNCFAQVPGRARPRSLDNALTRSPRG